MAKLFRDSFFGYSKADVIAYISQMNEDFSKKLLVKDQENRLLVQRLEEQLTLLQQENEALRAQQQQVALALIDAKSFANDLRIQAQEEDRLLQQKNAERRREELQRLENVSGRISRLQDAIRDFLHSMDEDLEEQAVRCQLLMADEDLGQPENPEGDGSPT